MDDGYIFRRELDFLTKFPEMIVQLKTNPQFSTMDIPEKKELYDKYYATMKQFFLSGSISDENKYEFEKPASQHISECDRQEWEKALIKEGYYDG
ncbi:MAG: hypothetical protein P4L69_14145 [Desulfosporosinus sp.]|nr:hypothetical protein [Desulfosporosinus sp.]